MRLLNRITILLLLAYSSSNYAESIDTEKLPKVNSVAQFNSKGSQYFVATNVGLFVSDNGRKWERSHSSLMPVTMVSRTGSGELYAFILNDGLVKYDKSLAKWKRINNQFGSQVLMDISSDEHDRKKLVAINQFGRLIASNDAGKSWHSIKGEYQATSSSEKRGQSIYREKCQSCHGINGVGETYNTQSLTDKEYIRAPALDASEHAWHHTDEGLRKTILDGSPRSKRMMAWKNTGISDDDAKDLVAYIKSLWTQRELDCQGPKHMQCMK